jgi:membrane protease YdiL (CAAX protease family)
MLVGGSGPVYGGPGKKGEGSMAGEIEGGTGAVQAVAPMVVRPPTLVRKIVTFPLVLMVIAILAFAAGTALSIWLISLLHNHDAHSPLLLLNAPIVILSILPFYWLFSKFVAREPMQIYGRERWPRELLAGVALGFGLFSITVALAAILGLYHVDGWGDEWTIWAELTTSALIPGFTEELLFRGILFRYIERAAGSWTALALTSILFGAAHLWNPGATWFSSFAIAVEAGILLGAIYMVTRRLWAAMGLHAAWNFTQGWIFGLPVSGSPGGNGLVHGRLTGPELLTGGVFGLEASILALIVATSAGAALLVVAHRKSQFVAPMWRGRPDARAIAAA